MRARASLRVPVTILLAALAGALLVVAGGPAHNADLAGLAVAFGMLRWGAYLATATALAAVIVLLIGVGRAPGRWLMVLALALAVPAAWGVWELRQQAGSVPPIHDITTDTADPPRFIAVREAREPGSNDADYAGDRVARRQAEAYPDIVPIHVPVTPEWAFDAALMAVREFGWRVVAQDAAEGRIEATAETPWFGFLDDVVIRIREDATGSRVDIRSASRVGAGDMGTNAERIRAFRERLLDALDRVAEPVGGG